jgi:hypothetical protein
MKTIIAALCIIALSGCRIERDIPVEFVKVELIRIDTVFRYPKDRKLLTWQDEDKIRYTSTISIEKHIAVGSTLLVMKRN